LNREGIDPGLVLVNGHRQNVVYAFRFPAFKGRIFPDQVSQKKPIFEVQFEQFQHIPMKVFINTEVVQIFEGATLGDAIRAYSKEAWQKLMNGTLTVSDRFGNQTLPDGELKEGDRFTLTENHEK
jgi:hypothetical protein